MLLRLSVLVSLLGPYYIFAQWSAFCTGNTDGFVVDFAAYNDTIYSTGFFHTICDEEAAFVASWDGANWHATGANFEQEGHALDSINGQLYVALYQFTTDSNYVFTYNGNEWSRLGNGVVQNNPGPGFPKNANIYDIVEFDGKIIACGDFDTYDDIEVNGIMQWDGTQWLPLGDGLTEFIPGMPSILYPHNMTVFDGDLIVAGNFYKAGGIIVNGIARWDGTTWHAMGDGFNKSVYAVGVFNDTLYAGGEFTMSGTQTMSCIAKWNGSSWVNPGIEVSYTSAVLHEFVHTLRSIDGKLYITGGFDQVNAGGISEAAGSILTYDGTTLDILEGGVAGEIEAVTPYENGILVAGNFNAAGAITTENFAVFQFPVSPVNDQIISAVTVFPNPASDFLQVHLGDGVCADIIITDMQGKSYYHSESCSATEIDLTSYPSGCYVIEVKNAQNSAGTLVFVD